MRRLVLLIVALACGLGAFSSTAFGARFYTPDYGSGPPEVIGGFDLGADGAIDPLSGSPFPAYVEPSPVGGIWGLGFTPDGDRAASAFLFNGGAQGYSFAGGTPAIAGKPIATASATSIAVSPDGRFAFAPTREFGAAPAEGIRRFAIGADGALTALLPSAGATSDYGDIAISPDGKLLFASLGAKVERFTIGTDGSLASLGTTPSPAAQFLAVSPDGRFLFLGLGGGSGFATYAIGPTGSLTAAGMPLEIPGGSGKIIAAGIDSRHAYLPDYNKDLIYTIAIAADGTPTIAGETPVVNPESVAVSPDGRYLLFYKTGSENEIGVAAIGPDGVPVVIPETEPWSTGEPERIVFQPRPAPVARFSVTAGVAGQATKFNASGSERAVRYDWDFGDGSTLADGGPTPTHVYAQAGDYQATLVVTDNLGCSSRQIYTGQSTVCPGGSAPRASAVVAISNPQAVLPISKAPRGVVPEISRIRVTPRKFAPKLRGVDPGAVKMGTTFRYTLSESAGVRFKIERKQGKRFKKLGSRSKKSKAGANRLKWNGKLKGKPLAPGAYRATVVATDASGKRSLPKTVGFRILPLPPLS
ncbi:MAG TPA: PKD domain-containing protein [Solirubrobacterales bacterium]|nr:PKD domain-containing protein [Solirubrobacterales bacterium]